MLRREDGIALILVLLVMAALAGGLTTVIVTSTSSGHTASRAASDQEAYNLAEAGINSAMSALHATDAHGASVNALDANALPAPGTHQDTYSTGHVIWGGTFDATSQSWTITSTGYARNGGGVGLPDRTRTLSAVTLVQPSLTQPVNNAIWNYIYAWNTSGVNNCDVDIANNVTVYAPLYVEGNLCLANNAAVMEASTSTPVSVVVKRKVAFSNNSHIGSSSSKISEAHLVGGCGTSLTSVHTCKSSDPVYARILDANTPAISPVTPSWNGYYATANPGPAHPCDVTTALRAPTFDNDGSLNLDNNGSAGTLDLTPSQSYTCKGYDSAHNLVGELSWNASTKVLTVKGVIYFDGNLTMSNGGVNEYNGQATLYVTGYTTLNGKMCGKRVSGNSDCDFSTWNPNTEMLIVVAHGNDGAGNSVTFSNNAKWQGGLYSQNTVNFNNNAVVEGPVLAGYVDFSNNVSAKPFPLITTVPLGAPGNPNVYADAQAPTVTG